MKNVNGSSMGLDCQKTLNNSGKAPENDGFPRWRRMSGGNQHQSCSCFQICIKALHPLLDDGCVGNKMRNNFLRTKLFVMKYFLEKYFYWTSQSNKHSLYASLVSDRPIVCQAKLSNTTGTCLQIFIQFRKWPGKCQMYVTFSCMNKILQVQINSNMVWNKFSSQYKSANKQQYDLKQIFLPVQRYVWQTDRAHYRRMPDIDAKFGASTRVQRLSAIK